MIFKMKSYNKDIERMILQHIINEDKFDLFDKGYDYFNESDYNDIFGYIKDHGIHDIDPIIMSNDFENDGLIISEDNIKLSLNGIDWGKINMGKVESTFKDWFKGINETMNIQGLMKARVDGDDIKVKQHIDRLKNFDELILDIDDVELIDDISNTPFIDDGVYDNMPHLIREITDNFVIQREKDLVLTTFFSVIGILFDGVHCIWDGKTDKCNINTFIAAPAASGKGMMVPVKKLLNRYHKEELDENEKRELLVKLNNSDKELDEMEFKPKHTIIPGDASSAAFRNQLDKNGGKGLIFVSEADDIIGNKNQEWGNYDRYFRTAFHNETIDSIRSEGGIVYIENSYISSSISGTFDQVIKMFGNSDENGLFSRFIFYLFKSKDEWRRHSGNLDDIDTKMDSYKDRIFDIYSYYKDKDIEIKFTDKQITRFDDVFTDLYNKYKSNFDGDFSPSIKRLGVICRKMIMIFTVFRHYEKVETFIFLDDVLDNEVKELECKDMDVYNGLSLIKTYIQHTSLLFSSFSFNSQGKKRAVIKGDNLVNILKDMSETFSSADYYKEATKKGVHYKKSQRFLKKCVENKVIDKLKRGEYKKL